MQRITLSQPYATLVALGEKRFHVQDEDTGHRGPLEVYASDAVGGLDEQDSGQPPIRDLLTKHNLTYADLPRGQVVATVNLVAVHLSHEQIHKVSRQERKLNKPWHQGKYMLQFADIQPAPVVEEAPQQVFEAPRKKSG